MKLSRRTLLAAAPALAAACQSNIEIPDIDPYAYTPASSFLTDPRKSFRYLEHNKIDYQGGLRSERTLFKHRPIITLLKSRREFIVTFGQETPKIETNALAGGTKPPPPRPALGPHETPPPPSALPHPHMHGHWWGWVEASIHDGTTVLREYPEPDSVETMFGKNGESFSVHFAFQTELSRFVRIRACCRPHGVFTDYVIIEDGKVIQI